MCLRGINCTNSTLLAQQLRLDASLNIKFKLKLP